MYINFWYPICTSEELNNDKPIRAELLGVRLAAFRDSAGEAHVLSDVCVHRGGSLSKGKVDGDCVQCPYHGWKYSGNGACAEIPSTNGRKPPARAKIDSYPVYEKYGVVFAFLGDLPEAERPPKPVVDEADQEGWRVTGPVVFEVDAYFERSVENGMDPVHNEFVHPSQGAPAIDEDRFTVEEQPWGCLFEVAFGDYKDVEARQKVAETFTDETGGLRAGSWHIGPNTLMTGIHLPNNVSFIQYFFEAPIDKKRTKIYFINARNNTLEADKDEWINGTFMNIAAEDRGIIENLRPHATPDTMTKELLLPGDAAVVKYREYLKTWENQGWRIDWPTLRRDEEDVAYAIPSPARRDSRNWVIDTIPVMPTSD
jgi:phenylpropionate dioxygenase-like ring-hydroxylating dioxygenase large terminal subunit